MPQSNDVLEPRLVPVDSYYLSVIDDRIQDLSNDSELASIVSEMLSGLILLPEIKVNDYE